MATVRDPVCHREFDEADAVESRDHEGTTYHFDDGSCARAFAQHPEDYLAEEYAPEEVGASGIPEDGGDVRHPSRADGAVDFG